MHRVICFFTVLVGACGKRLIPRVIRPVRPPPLVQLTSDIGRGGLTTASLVSGGDPSFSTAIERPSVFARASPSHRQAEADLPSYSSTVPKAPPPALPAKSRVGLNRWHSDLALNVGFLSLFVGVSAVASRYLGPLPRKSATPLTARGNVSSSQVRDSDLSFSEYESGVLQDAPWSSGTRYSQAPIRISDTVACDIGAICLPEERDTMLSGDAGPIFADQLTKMVFTLGPASSSVETLTELIRAGMNVARLNFSHGDHASQQELLHSVRKAAEANGKPVGIMLDTKGPEIRTGKTRDDGKIKYERSELITLTSDYDRFCDSHTLPLSYSKFPELLKVGQPVRIGDGALNLEVVDVSRAAEGEVQARVLNNATIGARKNCNLPGVRVDLPLLQPKDKHDLLEFALPNGVDFVALSFVQDGSSVNEVRQLLLKHCPEGQSPPKLISKIENGEGLRNFDEILEASDGIMVARGDLGMEIPPEDVFFAQKLMIGRCNLAGKFVITATQMLESMTGSPRPTRAEAGDVANAVLDGSDAVMLSGETAAGLFPIEAATIMGRICKEAERSIDYGANFQRIEANLEGSSRSDHQGVCHAAVRLALDCRCAAILAVTRKGFTAKELAKYKPPMPIVAATSDAATCRSLALVRGVAPIMVPALSEYSDLQVPKLVRAAIDVAEEQELVLPGDSVVVVFGSRGHDMDVVTMVRLRVQVQPIGNLIQYGQLDRLDGSAGAATPRSLS